MTAIEIQFSEYVRNVRCNARTAMALATRLEKAAPGDLTAEQRRALRAMLDAANDLQSVQSERDRLGPTTIRPLLLACANDWSALVDALRATARVPSDVSDHGPRAARMLASLFPDGAAFMQLEADGAWGEAKRRLVRIEQEELAEPLADLIGAHFLAAAKRSTERLGDGIGTGPSPRTFPSSTGLAEALSKFGRSVGAYGRTMVATVDEDDEESVERFMRAMQPIDAYRAARAGGSEPEPLDPEPTDPGITPVPTPSPGDTDPTT